jgi:hypothetical protein
MGGRKVKNRMKLKAFIEMEIQKLESELRLEYARGYYEPDKSHYLMGKIDALKWVLNA